MEDINISEIAERLAHVEKKGGRSIANPQTNGYYKFNKQFLEPIPFPVENFNNDLNGTINDLALTAKAIKRTQGKFLAASPHQQRTFAAQLKKHWIRLDELVYDLYELEETEKNSSEIEEEILTV